MWIVGYAGRGYRWDTQGQLGDGSLAPLQGVAANTNQSESDNQLSALAALSYLLASGAGGVRKVSLWSAGVPAYQKPWSGVCSACLRTKTLVCLTAYLPAKTLVWWCACLPACVPKPWSGVCLLACVPKPSQVTGATN